MIQYAMHEISRAPNKSWAAWGRAGLAQWVWLLWSGQSM